jgi:predicted O-linked N-acetylglucosamine transferase (SPINDLY family)
MPKLVSFQSQRESALTAASAALAEGRLSDAERHLRAVTYRVEDDPDTLNLLGVLRSAQGRSVEALAWLRRALALRPRASSYWLNLALALRDAGDEGQAVKELESLVAAHPDFGDAWFTLGEIREAADDAAGSEHAYRRAAVCGPGDAEAAIAVARMLERRGQCTAAADELQSLLAADPDNAAAAFCLATLLPAIPDSVGDINFWRTHYAERIEGLLKRPLRTTDPLRSLARPAFFLSYHGVGNRALLERTAQAMLRAAPSLAWEAPFCSTWRPPSARRIRVGFISKFMRDHSIGRTTSGLVRELPRDRFEVVSVFVQPYRKDDPITRTIQCASDSSLVLPPTLEAARSAIASLELDILFYQDIGMEPFTFLLAFSRLAPVQCVSFGHPDTTGIPNVDYFVSSDLFEVQGAQADYSEHLYLLEGAPTLAYHERPRMPQPPFGRADFGLPEDARLYGCPQTLYKLHPDFDAILLDILARDPGGGLVLVRPQVQEWLTLLLRRLHERMPSCLQRIFVVPAQPRDVFVNLLATFDVMLDPPQFNGMNSSLEALSIGTPIVTWPGRLQRTRHTAAMYRAMGIDEPIAGSANDYVELAVGLANDAARRERLRQLILERNRVLFENASVVDGFARFFEWAIDRRAGHRVDAVREGSPNKGR